MDSFERAILETAEEEFVKYEYSEVKISNIIKRLKMDEATFYGYFNNKHHLYQSVLKEILLDYTAEIRMIFMQNLEAEILFRSYVKTITTFITQRPNIIPIMLRAEANFEKDIDIESIMCFEKSIEYLNVIIDLLDLKEEYKDISAYTLYAIIYGSIENFYLMKNRNISHVFMFKPYMNVSASYNDFSSLISDMLLEQICNKDISC